MGKKITALTEETTPLTTDLMPVVDDPAGTPITKKMTLANMKTFTSASPTLVTPTVSGAITFAVGETIGMETNDMHFDVTIGDTFSFDIDGTPQMIASAAILDVADATNIVWAGNGNRAIFNNGTGFIFKVETSDNFDWQINAVPQMVLSLDKLDLLGHDLDNVQNIIHDLSTSGTDIDFNEDELQEISITGATTFTGANYAIGKSKSVKLTDSGSGQTLAFPSGWVFVGAKPTAIAASKVAILSLTSYTAAESGVVCAYSEQT